MRADESSRGFLRPLVEQTDVREEDDHGEAEEPVDRARRCRREREESDVDRERDDEEHDPENRQPVEGVRPTALAVHRVLVLSCEPYIDPNHITVPARYPPRYCVSPETHTLSESETAFVGAFATDVETRLAERLADARPAIDWGTEYRLETTPVDVGGCRANRLVVVELEWRRADPADNTAKLFRHAVGKSTDADRLVVFQVFTRYYDLVSGDISSKRKNAEFVGRVAADALDGLSYRSLTIDVDPPKRGGERPESWQEATDAVAETIAERY